MAVLKDLIVHGASRFVNVAQFNSLSANKISAEEGIFNKLIATNLSATEASITNLTAQNATVVGLLDVQGQLHTNSWTQSNIATIDGSFFITPTVSVQEGTFTYSPTANSNKGQITLNAKTNYSFGVDGNWTTGSLVMITGQVAGSDAMKPLGTIRGVLYSANANTIIINGSFSDAIGNNCAILQELGAVTSVNGKDLKVSLYQKSISGGLAPLGIYMTSGGMNTQNISFIDIYNGGNATSTAPTTGGISSGAFAKPVLRIGNLAGLGATGGQTPTGYGIYTTNGYFEGIITAKAGYIGGTSGWIINSTNIHSPSGRSGWNTNVNGIWIATDVIAGGKQMGSAGTGYAATDPVWYVKADGSAKFGAMTLTSAGVLSVPAANIAGKLTAAQVDVSGVITAGSIVTNTLTGGTFNTTDYIRVSTQASSSLAIGNSGAKTDWRIIAGKSFGVDKAGNMYATSANITGTITAKNGTIGGFHISSTADTSAYTGHVYTSSLYRHSGDGTYDYEVGIKGDGGEPSSSSSGSGSGNLAFYVKRVTHGNTWVTDNISNMFYITHGGYLYAQSASITGTINATSGYFKNIEIRNSNNATVAKLVSNQLTFYYNSSGTTVQKVADVGADGMIFYRNGSKRAATTANGLTIYGSDGTTTVANFGATAQIGVAANSKSRVLINAGNIQIINRNSDGDDITLTTTTSGMWTEANATTTTAASGAILPSTYIRAGIQFSRPDKTTGKYGVEGKAFYAGCWAPQGETIGNRANFYVHQDGWMKVRSIVLASSITGTDSSGYSYSDCNIYILLDVNAAASSTANATSGADAGLFNAIRALGWYNDMIVPT